MEKTAIETVEKDILIRREEVMRILSDISVATLYRMVDNGRLPKPIKLSRGIAVWKRSWIQGFIDKLESGDSLVAS